MGLDISHDCFSGPYSYFMRFRVELAKAAGIPLWIMADFYRPDRFSPPVHSEIAQFLPLSWKPYESDALCILLHHSDCEGTIGVEDCKKLLPRLKELLPIMASAPEGYGYQEGEFRGLRNTLQRFIEGLEDAISQDEPISFH